jgi:hypothetical protein
MLDIMIGFRVREAKIRKYKLLNSYNIVQFFSIRTEQFDGIIVVLC